ncbi:MAG: hypothetical protein Q9165_000328 [Trypethelium subeluteriae]
MIFSVNIFYTSFGRLRSQIDKRLVKLQSLTVLVDEEARIASDELQEELQRSHHLEILQRLPSKGPLMLLRREPFDNLPTIKNNSFHGRTAELQRLEQRLKPGTPPEKLLTACLCGLGGVGKTQIALEFAYRFIEDYDAILWISAENSLKLGDSFSAIAHDLGLADNSIQNPNQLRSSEYATKWLLIFDNVEDPSLVLPYWPSSAKGAIVLTTRNSEAARLFTNTEGRLDIYPFPIDDGKAFLLSLAETDLHAHAQIGAQELAAADTICQSVGLLPLALDILGSYIASCGIKLSRFVELHPSFERDLLFDNSVKACDGFFYQKSIDTTWTLTEVTSKSGPIVETRLFEGPDLLSEFPDIEKVLQNPFEKSAE